MSGEELITHWIDGLRNGDDEAASRIWASFSERLMNMAQKRLKTTNRSVYDEEDVVVSVFKSFCLGIRNGKFPQIRDREDLWRLLFVIAARKISDRFAFQHREKRDTRREVSSDQTDLASSKQFQELFVSNEPSPEFATECAEQLQVLLSTLQLEDLQQVAILKMEGFTNEEIAIQMARSVTTVERKLRTIREIWNQVDA